jgi:serine/threonine-protein kinase
MSCPRCGSANDPDTVTCRACGALLLRVGALPDGFLIGSRYEIVRRIGAGGMGMVYEAFDRVLEEDVAIKVLRPEIADHPDMARRFRQEIKLARRVRHRNVCGIHEYGEMGDLRYIAMEYVRGVNLRKMLRQEGAFAPLEAFAVCDQVAKGLQAIHDAGVIHRDLKTSNIMRDERGVVRVMDFGIAKQQGSEVTLAGIGPGLIVGTPEYMSPEQARADTVDFRSDIYSLGVVIYEIFTGDVPFRGDTPVATLMKHLSEPPPLTGPGVPPLPETLVPVLAKALAKAPAERYGDARELLSAMRAAGGAASLTPPPRDLPAAAPLFSSTEPLHHPGAPTAVPESIVTEVADPTQADPADGFAGDDAPVRRARFPVPRRLLAAALAVPVVLAAGVVIWTMRDRPRPAATPPPAAAPATGTVVVDALPWGEVERIVDAAGREWPVGADRYTPFVAHLPPGDYVIALRHPDAAEAASVRVTIRPAQLERRVVALREIDVDEYLHKAGF